MFHVTKSSPCCTGKCWTTGEDIPVRIASNNRPDKLVENLVTTDRSPSRFASHGRSINCASNSAKSSQLEDPAIPSLCLSVIEIKIHQKSRFANTTLEIRVSIMKNKAKVSCDQNFCVQRFSTSLENIINVQKFTRLHCHFNDSKNQSMICKRTEFQKIDNFSRNEKNR